MNNKSKRTIKKEDKKMRENQKGITLVALVITIIILIILSTVAINAIVGEDGLVERAQFAADSYSDAEKKDANTIAALEEEIDKRLEEDNKGIRVGDVWQGVGFNLPESYPESLSDDFLESRDKVRDCIYYPSIVVEDEDGTTWEIDLLKGNNSDRQPIDFFSITETPPGGNRFDETGTAYIWEEFKEVKCVDDVTIYPANSWINGDFNDKFEGGISGTVVEVNISQESTSVIREWLTGTIIDAQ